VCVCSLRYPACNAHAPYCIFIRGHSDCTVFFHKWNDFRVSLIEHKACFDFLYDLSGTFHALKIIQRDIIANVPTASCKVPLFLTCFKEAWIFSTDFRETLKFHIFHENSICGSRVVPCRRRDRHYDANRCISQCCEKRLKTKISIAPLWKPEVSHNRG
jgi:hypothetical protein